MGTPTAVLTAFSRPAQGEAISHVLALWWSICTHDKVPFIFPAQWEPFDCNFTFRVVLIHTGIALDVFQTGVICTRWQKWVMETGCTVAKNWSDTQWFVLLLELC